MSRLEEKALPLDLTGLGMIVDNVEFDDETPRSLDHRKESLPSPSLDTRHQVIRVNCLYVSRRQLRQATEAFNVSHVNRDASVTLAPGVQASVQVVQASKAVKAHVVFDFRIAGKRPKIADLEREIRRNLSIPLGVELLLQVIPTNGEHAIKVSTDIQLAEVIAAQQDEITVQVVKCGSRSYLPWVAIVVSLADVATTILFGLPLVSSDQRIEFVLGAAVLGAAALAICLNLCHGFLHVKTAISCHQPTQEWIAEHVCETAFGLLIAGLNVLNLECLWSHLELGFCFDFHCPVPPHFRRMSGRNSIPALILSDAVPIAASLYQMLRTSDATLFGIASVSTSVASLALALLKKLVVALFVQSGQETVLSRRAAADEQQAAEAEDYGSLLKKRELTLARFVLENTEDLEERPRALAALACKFHEVVFLSVRSHGGTVVSFTANEVEAAYNAPRELSAHTIAAVRSAVEVQGVWPEAKRAALSSQKTSYNVTVAIITGEACAGRLGCRTRREFKIVGGVLSLARELSHIAAADSVGIITNEAAGHIAKREAFLLRQVDRVKLATGASSVLYQVIPSHSPLGKLWGGATVHHWDTIFVFLSANNPYAAIELLNEFLSDVIDPVAEKLRSRLLKAVGKPGFKPAACAAGAGEESPENATPSLNSLSPHMRSPSEMQIPGLSLGGPAAAQRRAGSVGTNPTVDTWSPEPEDRGQYFTRGVAGGYQPVPRQGLGGVVPFAGLMGAGVPYGRVKCMPGGDEAAERRRARGASFSNASFVGRERSGSRAKASQSPSPPNNTPAGGGGGGGVRKVSFEESNGGGKRASAAEANCTRPPQPPAPAPVVVCSPVGPSPQGAAAKLGPTPVCNSQRSGSGITLSSPSRAAAFPRPPSTADLLSLSSKQDSFDASEAVPFTLPARLRAGSSDGAPAFPARVLVGGSGNPLFPAFPPPKSPFHTPSTTESVDASFRSQPALSFSRTNSGISGTSVSSFPPSLPAL
ncbi:hypothetical protein DIPPA_03292 [Diplonema papillatum]|nr:hypothetical protein DIPPA_03292 [Diplonema papillatum]